MFEYNIFRSTGFVAVEDLNKLGKDGWELVFIAPDDDGMDYIFKRFVGHNNIFKFVRKDVNKI
jgi:hypothetical protein